MSNHQSFLYLITICVFITIPFKNLRAQHIWPEDADRYTNAIPGQEALGHWDIDISKPQGDVGAAWLEIAKSGSGALVGRFVGQGGSARPISEVKYNEKNKTYSFTIPPQWGSKKDHLVFKLKNGKLSGKMNSGNGKGLSWKAVRSPELKQKKTPEWGEPVDLLKSGMSAWKDTAGWKVENGILSLKGKGDEEHRSGNKNIKTKQKFDDFKMHVEFRYGEGANSGIYLRGRYELQILDSYGMNPESHTMGGIYGFVAPAENLAKKPGHWQTMDITLIGRMVTVELNGKEIISNRSIPGITGGAVDSHEGAPGPIMIQGDHYGKLEFRNMSIMPAE